VLSLGQKSLSYGFFKAPLKKPALAGFFYFNRPLSGSVEPGQQTEGPSLAIIEGFVWHLDFERSQRPRKSH
jgi:hypothetical protein